MTSSVLFWIRLAVFAYLAYSLFAIARNFYRKKYIVPRNKTDWKDLVEDLISIGISVFLLFIIERNYQAPFDTVLAYKNKSLPAFSFYNFNNSQREGLESYKGKTVLLNVWATWCGPCRKEMPHLDKLSKDFSGKDFVILAISDEDTGIVRSFLNQNRFSFVSGSFLQINDALNEVPTRPFSVLIDKNGEVKDMVVGSRGYNFFKNWIKDYVK